MDRIEKLRLNGRIPGHRPLVVHTTTYTRQLFVEEMAYSPPLEETVDLLKTTVTDAAGHIASEVFAKVYDGGASRRVSNPHPSTAWVQAWHDDLDASPEFRGFQRRYRYDAEGAGLATLYLVEGLVAAYRAAKPECEHRYNPDEPAGGGEGEEGLGVGRGWSAFADGASEPPAALTPEEAEAQVAQALATAEKMKGLADFISSRGVQKAARVALKKARAELATYRDAYTGLGMLDRNGTPANGVTPATRTMLAKRLKSSPRLREIAALAGRFRVLARDKQRAEPGPGASEVVELELGNNIQRVVPAELLGLVLPEMGDLFARRFLDRGLTQYKVHAPVPKGRGPIIFCVDVSGSMSANGGKDPDLWAKAVFAGVAEIALRQKRWCHAILFNTGIELERAFDPKVPATEGFADVFSCYPRGGTDYGPPLGRSLAILREAQKTAVRPLKRADIVFITDGCAPIPYGILTELQRMKQSIGLSIIGVMIGDDDPAQVAAFADTMHSVKEFADKSEKSALDIFGGLVKPAVTGATVVENDD